MDHYRTYRKANIQTCAGDVVEMHPPSALTIADYLLEDESYVTPTQGTQRGSLEEVVHAAKENRGVKEADSEFWEGAREDVDEEGCYAAGEPEPLESSINRTS